MAAGRAPHCGAFGNIVGESLTIMVLAVTPLPLYYALDGDERLTIRLLSVLVALTFLVRIWRTFGESREWGRRHVLQVVAIVGLQAVAQLANVWLASLALLMFGFLVWLMFPIQLLFRIIRDFQPPLEGE